MDTSQNDSADIDLLRLELQATNQELIEVKKQNELLQAKLDSLSMMQGLTQDSTDYKFLYEEKCVELTNLQKQLAVYQQESHHNDIMADYDGEEDVDLSEECVNHLRYLQALEQEMLAQEKRRNTSETKRDNNEKIGLWSDDKSIAEQLKDVANKAITDGMIWCDDYQMYYDNESKYYYSHDMAMSYDPENGIYYTFNKESNEYEYHSQVEPSQQELLGREEEPSVEDAPCARLEIFKWKRRRRRKRNRRLKAEKKLKKQKKEEEPCPPGEDGDDTMGATEVKVAGGMNDVENHTVKGLSNREDGELTSDDEVKEDRSEDASNGFVDIGDICDLMCNINVDENDWVDEMWSESCSEGEIVSDAEGGVDMNLCFDHVNQTINQSEDYQKYLNIYRRKNEYQDSALKVIESGPKPPTENNVSEGDSHIYPPGIRAMVIESDCIPVGSLYLVTYTGGVVGSLRQEGRQAIHIEDERVSKVHAEFIYNDEDKCYYIVDQNSTNGTYINGEKLIKDNSSHHPPYRLTHLDRLMITTSHQFELHIHCGNDTCDGCEPGLVQPANKGIYATSVGINERRKQELKTIKKKYRLQGEGPSLPDCSRNYSDRAKTRRRTVGSDNPYQPDEEPATVQRAIPQDNKGHKLLEKMGWKTGTGLGKSNAGISEPIQTDFRQNAKAGLGSSAAALTSIDNAGQKDRNAKWRNASERYNQIKEKEEKNEATDGRKHKGKKKSKRIRNGGGDMLDTKNVVGKIS